jgi:hypothetical protein
MAMSALCLAGSIAAFLLDQIIAGVICIVVSATLSFSFLEYTCVRHHPITTQPQTPPPLQMQYIEVVVSKT